MSARYPRPIDRGWNLGSGRDRRQGLAFAGRFRIAAGKLGAVSETDGIEAVAGDFGPGWPGGLFVAQDGDNAPAAQNFKLVAWDDVVKAFGLHATPAAR